MWYIYTYIFYKVYIYKKQPAKVLEPITVTSHPKIAVSRSEIEDTQLRSHYFLNLKLHEWCYEDMLLRMIINTHNVTYIHLQLSLGWWKKIVITTECSWVTVSNIMMDVMAGMNPLQDSLLLNLFQSQRRRHRWKAAEKYIRIF